VILPEKVEFSKVISTVLGALQAKSQDLSGYVLMFCWVFYKQRLYGPPYIEVMKLSDCDEVSVSQLSSASG